MKFFDKMWVRDDVLSLRDRMMNVSNYIQGAVNYSVHTI